MPIDNPGEVGASTKEFFSSVTYTTANIRQWGDFPTAFLIALNNAAWISFHVPHDFTAIVEAVIIVIPDRTTADADWDIYSDYGASGEAYNTHSEQDVATLYNVTANQLFEVDISGILSALAADDYVGIQLKLADALDAVNVVGVRFKYN
ncbi:unnamed protein product [marine sediment metagenome]|uniref:Uncharacterized protein n=1 Tax=marine sediment metagenome TaxID=412755 RepID=X1RTG8_9ZZZZ